MVNVKVYMRDTALSDLGVSEDELAPIAQVIPARLSLPVVAQRSSIGIIGIDCLHLGRHGVSSRMR
jgi:hypothetical protein